MAEIQLNRGYAAQISESDVARISERKWFIVEAARGYVYAACKDQGRILYLHRFVAGATKGSFVDHINGDRLDNRRENLRLCSHAENMRNRKAGRPGKFKGVRYLRDCFKAYISHQNVRHYLGSFKTAKEAARAYDNAAKQLHGPFALLNFPNDQSTSPPESHFYSQERSECETISSTTATMRA